MIDPESLSDCQLLHGSVDPLPERVPLRAGPVTLVFEAGDLRSVRLDDLDLINRIYGAVRNGEWATIPGRLSDLRIVRGDDWFRVTYTSEHVAGDVDFVWRAEIDGTAEGVISFAFAGDARARFARNRIGLCVLHPLSTGMGRGVTARLVGGGSRVVRFPRDVSVEQPIVGFHDLAGLVWSPAPGVEVDLQLEGDTFETEDQRNWIDPSFKTYSTPLSLPRPVVIEAGTRIRQKVTLRVRPAAAARPAIGLGTATHAPSSRQLDWLRALDLSHLRVDLDLDSDCAPRLAQAMEQATSLGCALELALHVGEKPEASLRRLADALPAAPAVARVLVIASGHLATTAAALDAVRHHLIAGRPDLGPLGSGSAMDLYQVHLLTPPLADAVFWGMHPQAHATDLTSIAETPCAAGHQVRTMKARRPETAVAISPVRFHKTAVDDRLRTLFAAAWTLATLAELVAAGADSVTAFETAGPRGVMDGDQVFPLYHAVADMASGTPASRSRILRPCDGVTGLLRGRTVLLANLAREAREVDLPAGFTPLSFRTTRP